MDLLAYSTSLFFFPCSFNSGFALNHLCSSVFFFLNNPLVLVKVRLLWVYLVLENLKERGKEMERKKNIIKQIRLFLDNLKEKGFLILFFLILIDF